MRIASIVPAMLGAALVLSLAHTAAAQDGPQTYGLPVTLAQAAKVMDAAMAEAKKNNWTVAVTIVDSGAHVVMIYRMDNVQLAGVEIATNKATTSVKLKRPSKALHDVMEKGGSGLRMLVLYPGVTPIEGGVLLAHEGKIVGAIGVSGGTAAQDGQVAKAGADALK